MASMKTSKDTAAVSAALVRFVEKEADGETVLMRFDDPAPMCAAVRIASLKDETIPAGLGEADLTVVMIASGLANRKERLEQARDWLKAQSGPPAVRISLEETGWILFRSGQAVIAAPAEEMDGLLEAVVDFAHHERQLRLLETEAAANWNTAQGHLSLIHTVTNKELKKTKDVGNATKQAMLRRMSYARLEPHMTLTPERFKGAAREAARRLRERPSIEARLEAIDGQIEVYEDIYDMANQRRGEYENFIRGYRVEIAILLVLAAELFLIIWDVYLSHFRADS
jgi:hypothetical protein